MSNNLNKIRNKLSPFTPLLVFIFYIVYNFHYLWNEPPNEVKFKKIIERDVWVLLASFIILCYFIFNIKKRIFDTTWIKEHIKLPFKILFFLLSPAFIFLYFKFLAPIYFALSTSFIDLIPQILSQNTEYFNPFHEDKNNIFLFRMIIMFFIWISLPPAIWIFKKNESFIEVKGRTLTTKGIGFAFLVANIFLSFIVYIFFKNYIQDFKSNLTIFDTCRIMMLIIHVHWVFFVYFITHPKILLNNL